MILTSTYSATFALMVLATVCWGSWANSFKTVGKWRFELYYFDYAMGAVVASLITAFTLGTLGFDGFTFLDDLLHASKRLDACAVLAGALFNLGNMLVVAAIAEAGLSVAAPIGLGIAIVTGSLWSLFIRPGGNIALLSVGSLLILIAVVLAAAAFRSFQLAKIDELVRTGQQKSTRRRVSSKAVTLSVLGGLLVGSYSPLIRYAMEGEAGLGPYSISVMLALGLFASTILFNLFFMNLPVSGPPIEIFEYMKGSFRQHAYGWLGGVVWYVGLAAALIALTAEGEASVAPHTALLLADAAAVIATLWGLFYWKEYPAADGRVRAMLFIMVALFICGISLLSVVPGSARG